MGSLMPDNHHDDPILELININKCFGINHIHKGIHLKLKKGECLGLLGGSGTGKSALLRSIIGLEHIDDGKILYKGQRIDQLNEKQLSKIRLEISYSFQSGALFDSINVYDNLAYPLLEHTQLKSDEITQKIHEMLGLIGLEGKEAIMPSDLSGGMQKRVGMARAMIMNPQIVLYDEPTAGLDPVNTLNVIEVMGKFKTNGRSSIFVTHDIPAAVKLCDRIAIIGEGKIIFEGSVEKFKNSDDPQVKKFMLNSTL